MSFALFVALNAVLLLRPEELFPELAGLRLYLIVIVLCTAISLPRLIELLSPRSLRERPIAVCVLLFYLSIVLNLVICGRINEAFFEFGAEFGKIILYYFLMLAVIDSRERFRMFIASLVFLIGGLTCIALVQQYGLHEFPNIDNCIQKEIDPQTGEEYELRRLVSSGIFNDPNDLCLILGLGILCSIYRATTGNRGDVLSYLWLLPIPLFAFAILETHSRGGVLGILAGCGAYLYSRHGSARILPVLLAGGVLVLLVIGGRQGSISGGGTAHDRLMLWSDGIQNVMNQPFRLPFGLGLGWYTDESGYVAHNSFVQAFIELGLLGGGAFLAAFYLAARLMDRLGREFRSRPWNVEARHFGFAIVIGYAVGTASLTRNFVIPTYMVLGIVSVLLDHRFQVLPDRFRVNSRWWMWFLLFSLSGFVMIYLAVRTLKIAGI